MTQERPSLWARVDPITKRVVETTVATLSWINSANNGDPENWIEFSNVKGDGLPGPCGIGLTYDSDLNDFIPESPYPSWILNRQTIEWEPPIQKPQEVFVVLGGPIGIQTTYKLHQWDEESTSWVVHREAMVPTGDNDLESEYYIAPTRTQEEAEADNV